MSRAARNVTPCTTTREGEKTNAQRRCGVGHLADGLEDELDSRHVANVMELGLALRGDRTWNDISTQDLWDERPEGMADLLVNVLEQVCHERAQVGNAASGHQGLHFAQQALDSRVDGCAATLQQQHRGGVNARRKWEEGESKMKKKPR